MYVCVREKGRERERVEGFKLFVSFTVILTRTKTSPRPMMNNGEYKCILKERGSQAAALGWLWGWETYLFT